MNRAFFVISVLSAIIFADDFPIVTATGNQTYPVVVWNGDCFIIVWEDYRAGATNPNIYGQSVNVDGTLGAILTPCVLPGIQTKPKLTSVFDGVTKVVWHNETSGNIGSTNTTCDELLVGDWIPPTVPAEIRSLAIGYSGEKILAVWRTTENWIGYLSFDTMGNASDTAEILGFGYAGNPAIAFDGHKFLVVWTDSSTAGKGIYGTYFGPDGNRITEPALFCNDLHADKPALCALYNPDPDEAGFGIAYQSFSLISGSDIYMGWIPDGYQTFVPRPVCLEDENQGTPDIVSVPIGFLVIWEDQRSGISTDIYGIFVTNMGYPLSEYIIITEASGGQNFPKIAYDEQDSIALAVWVDGRSGYNDDIYACLVHLPANTGPVATPVEPLPGTITADSLQNINISIYDSDHINETTIVLSVNGINYEYPEGHMTFVEPMLTFIPPSPFASGTVDVRLLQVYDILGCPAPETLSFSFIVDREPPTIDFTSYPGEMDTLSSEDFIVRWDDITQNLTRSECRISLYRVDGYHIRSWYADSLLWIDSMTYGVSISILLNLLDNYERFPDDTFTFCCRAGDRPDYGLLPNIIDTCWNIVYHGTYVSEKHPTKPSLIIFPNPFNSSVNVCYSSPGDGTLSFIDASGKLIHRTDVSGEGEYVWYGRNEQGSPLPSGKYWVELRTDDKVYVLSVMLLK